MSECPFKKPTKESYSKECRDPDKHAIIAHVINKSVKIEKSSPRREWMDKTHERFANGCLPLISANDLGWTILSPFDFLAVWDGTSKNSGVKIAYENLNQKRFAMSHFGHGILTFDLGYLFETTVGHGLYVKGPANSQKQYIQPLEGLVETDWLTYPFTMNWKFIEPKKEVLFQKGEPVCQIFPYPRDYINKFETIKRPLEGNMKERCNSFSFSRKQHNNKLRTSEERLGLKDILQNNYMGGQYHDGTKCEELGFKHEPRCKAKDFPKND